MPIPPGQGIQQNIIAWSVQIEKMIQSVQTSLTNFMTTVVGTYARKLNVLEKDGVIEYTPTENYHPATKKYVDDTIISGGGALYVKLSQAIAQTIGATGARLAHLFVTDITCTNPIAGSVTGNAATVTTNANLTGVITSIGNATSIASQTGTGTTFAMNTSPIFVTDITTPLITGGTKIGTGSNYTEFEADGTLKMVGTATVWEDVQFPISSGKVSAVNAPTWEAFTTNTSMYSFIVDDFIDLGANEVLHAWKEGSTASVHLHCAIKTAQSSGANRYAKFTIYLAYADVNEVWTEVTPLSAEYTIPTGTAALTHHLLTIGDLAMPNNLIGTQIKIRVKRIAATGGTEYADSMFISQVGIHVECDTIGSRTISTK